MPRRIGLQAGSVAPACAAALIASSLTLKQAQTARPCGASTPAAPKTSSSAASVRASGLHSRELSAKQLPDSDSAA